MAEKTEYTDIYEAIRNIGFGLETQFNEWIQDQLNKEKLVLPAAFLSNVQGKLIQFIREYQEIISLHLNTPTKDDVANVAKLLIQTEEKVDDLNDRMDDLVAVIEELRTGTYKRPASSHSSSARYAEKSVSKLLSQTEEKVNDLINRMDDLAAVVEELRKGTHKRPVFSHSSLTRYAKCKRKSEAKHNKKKVNLEELLNPAMDSKSFIPLDSAFGDEIFLKFLQDMKVKRRKKR
ncbi:hypothetical protein [Domibacillus robiginosus]|uniref:hypothetical protein n=1 Tax=Domibacillus robiginosus TaxID=1071054 RepID=UPI00067D23BA|nr:hypothetical protein [Domibacillus robiginosus]